MFGEPVIKKRATWPPGCVIRRRINPGNGYTRGRGLLLQVPNGLTYRLTKCCIVNTNIVEDQVQSLYQFREEKASYKMAFSLALGHQ